MLQVLVALACLLWLPALASAERALILPLRAERAIAESERAALLEALYTAVSAQGGQPVPDDRPAEGQALCDTAACLEPLLARSSAQHAIELTVWRAPDGAISGVSVSVVTPAAERYAEGAELASGGDLGAAVQTATQGAYTRFRRGPGPWLELDGTPAGAIITVDGQAAGALPRRVKVSGGLHRVVVSSPGYQAFEEAVTVPRNADALKPITVQLRPLPAHGARTASTAPSAASPWNYVIAGAAVAGAVLLALGPLRSAVEHGECGREKAGRCTGIVAFDAGEAVKLVGAGVLLAGGVTWLVISPLRTRGSSETAALSFRGEF